MIVSSRDELTNRSTWQSRSAGILRSNSGGNSFCWWGKRSNCRNRSFIFHPCRKYLTSFPISLFNISSLELLATTVRTVIEPINLSVTVVTVVCYYVFTWLIKALNTNACTVLSVGLCKFEKCYPVWVSFERSKIKLSTCYNFIDVV